MLPFLVLTGSMLACTASPPTKVPDGGEADVVSQADEGDGDGGADAAICDDLQTAYNELLSSARQCTVGAPDQCGVQAAASFFCYCTTRVNGHGDELAALVSQYKTSGCRALCTGTCAQPRAFACQADPTSPTGGSCKPQAVLDLTAADDGGSFSVAVGSEIDIVLQDIGANQYATQVMLSSDAATVLEITIPASAPNPGGPMHLYRIGAVSPGQVLVQIPRSLVTGDAALAPFTVTIDIH